MNNRTTEEPARPEAKLEPSVTPDVEAAVRERLETFDRDKQDASDWSDVRARILQQKSQS